MSLDQLVYAKLTSAPVMSAVGNRVYARGTLGSPGIPSNPDYPYIMYGAGTNSPNRTVNQSRRSYLYFYDVYVYDKVGSYKRIKDIHKLVLNAMEGLELMRDSDVSITEVALQGYSQDQYDEISRHGVVSGTYTILAGYNR